MNNRFSAFLLLSSYRRYLEYFFLIDDCFHYFLLLFFFLYYIFVIIYRDRREIMKIYVGKLSIIWGCCFIFGAAFLLGIEGIFLFVCLLFLGIKYTIQYIITLLFIFQIIIMHSILIIQLKV